MANFTAALKHTIFFVALILAPSAGAQTKPKRYCSPEVYTAESIDASMKVCDEIVADPRQPVSEKIQAYQNRGELFLRKKEYSSSLQNFNQAIALLGTQKIVPFRGFGGPALKAGSIHDIPASSVYSNRARLFERRKEYSRAIEDYTKALQIRPDDQGNLYSRAKSHEILGQYDRALEDLEKSIAVAVSSSQDPYSRDFSARGEIYLKKKEYDKAIRDFDKALELDAKASPNSVDKSLLASRGAAYLGKGDTDRALQDLDKAIPGNEIRSRYRNSRGLAYRKKGEIDRAIAEFDEAIKYAFASDYSDDDRAEYFVNRAEALGEKGEWLKALEDHQSALTISSSFSRAISGRNAARLALSRPAPAIAAAGAAETLAATTPAKPITAINERRVALVIGNSAYDTVAALPNPRRDAETLAQALRAAGFQTVQVAADLSRDKLARALQSFAAEADKADWAVVYFAGHGIEIGGVNYLLPVDVRLKSDRDVALEAVALDQVLVTVAGARKLRLVVLDACRDNPFVAKMTRSVAGRSVGRGLASIEPEGGTLVAFAAKHGQTALDGSQGANSPFVAAFVRHMQSPNVEISKMFRLVRDDVLAATGKQQEPFTYGSLPGQDFFFRVQ